VIILLNTTNRDVEMSGLTVWDGQGVPDRSLVRSRMFDMFLFKLSLYLFILAFRFVCICVVI